MKMKLSRQVATCCNFVRAFAKYPTMAWDKVVNRCQIAGQHVLGEIFHRREVFSNIIDQSR